MFKPDPPIYIMLRANTHICTHTYIYNTTSPRGKYASGTGKQRRCETWDTSISLSLRAMSIGCALASRLLSFHKRRQLVSRGGHTAANLSCSLLYSCGLGFPVGLCSAFLWPPVWLAGWLGLLLGVHRHTAY